MGGLLLQPLHPPTFFMAKNFLKIFSLIHGSLDKGWVNGPYGNLSKNTKTARGKIRKGGGLQQPPLLRERVKFYDILFIFLCCFTAAQSNTIHLCNAYNIF